MVTGTLFGPVLAGAAAEFEEMTGVRVTVLPVVNERLGATITVAGLLMGEDVVAQVKAAPAAAGADMVLLPRLMFDHPERIALDNVSPADVARALGRPVVLADTMGDVWDAVIGESAVVYRPE